MKKVNLRDLYPDVYKNDHFVEVTEDVLETIRAVTACEAAYDRRMFRYKAYYTLTVTTVTKEILPTGPGDTGNASEEKLLREQLYAAVMARRKRQAKRIYAGHYLGMRVSRLPQRRMYPSRVRDEHQTWSQKQLAKYF